jgi:Zn finger protein HypA/HybF involved in hydrogenase expression
MSVNDQLIMECTVCFDGFDLSQVFKTPRILPCGHTFCSECLARLVQADSSLKCPNCNSKIQNVILEVIPRNFNFMEILERRQKPAEEENLLCQTCESGDHQLERGAEASQSPMSVRQYLMNCIAEIFPAVFQHSSRIHQLVQEIHTHYRYLALLLSNASGPRADRERVQSCGSQERSCGSQSPR